MKKTHNNYSKLIKHNNHLLKFGQFGFKTNTFKSLSQLQQKLIFIWLWKKLKIVVNKKNIKIWSSLNFNQNLTKLNFESRMGKGKGMIYKHTIFLKPGTILFELDGIPKENIKEIFLNFNKKLPIKLILVDKYSN